MNSISVKKMFLVGAVMLVATCFVNADERLDFRIKHKQVSNRMATPRLALGALKEKDKKEELQVQKKVASSSSSTRRRITKNDEQRKKKTKRVVASQ